MVRKSFTGIVTLSSVDQEIRLGLWKIRILHHTSPQDDLLVQLGHLAP
jgi:hypothetical protein